MLIPKWRDWALQQLGVAELNLSVDLFATPWTTCAPLFLTQELDSFSYDWGSLQASLDDLLWANPPFAMLPRVVEKLVENPCLVVLITPRLEKKPWWEPLEALPHTKVTFPPRSHLFYGGIRKASLPQKAWRTMAWLVDTRTCIRISVTGPDGQPKGALKGRLELEREVAKIPKVHWTHGYQGGKPTVRDAIHQALICIQIQHNPTFFYRNIVQT